MEVKKSINPSRKIAIGLLIFSFILLALITISVFVPLEYIHVDKSLLSWIPKINVSLNTATAFSLTAGFFMIKRKDINRHKNFMILSFIFSALFLAFYLIYHTQSSPTIYGDIDRDGILNPQERDTVGEWLYIYYFVLITHIIFSFFIVPLVIFAFYYGLSALIEKHKKIVRWTYPIWLYVSFTGVLIYIMIKDYY